MVHAALFPTGLATFEAIDDAIPDAALCEWGHWLGGCDRPFGRRSFGLYVVGDLVAVAVSASTVNARCGGFDRRECVELARLCSHPEHRDMTRVALRLWRKIAVQTWPYWSALAAVSYANAARHSGDIYRFDGWKKVADAREGTAGGGWTRGKRYEAKTVWAFEYHAADPTRQGCRRTISDIDAPDRDRTAR